MINVSLSVDEVLLGSVPEVFGWERVLEICGKWDSQALSVAWFGLFCSLLTMFYWVRFRKYIGSDTLKRFLDKFLFTLNGLAWVIVIVRLMRAG